MTSDATKLKKAVKKRNIKESMAKLMKKPKKQKDDSFLIIRKKDGKRKVLKKKMWRPQ